MNSLSLVDDREMRRLRCELDVLIHHWTGTREMIPDEILYCILQYYDQFIFMFGVSKNGCHTKLFFNLTSAQRRMGKYAMTGIFDEQGEIVSFEANSRLLDEYERRFHIYIYQFIYLAYTHNVPIIAKESVMDDLFHV